MIDHIIAPPSNADRAKFARKVAGKIRDLVKIGRESEDELEVRLAASTLKQIGIEYISRFGLEETLDTIEFLATVLDRQGDALEGQVEAISTKLILPG